MHNFFVGFAKRDITPPLGTLLAGYPRERIAQRVMDPLYARAIAIKQENTAVIIISLDLTSINVNTSDTIRFALADALGICVDGITVSTTHTHSGPIVNGIPGWGNANDTFIQQQLLPGAIEAGKEAFANVQPAVMAIGTSESQCGINRRLVKNGVVDFGQNPDGPYNPAVTAVRFQSPEGKDIACLVHFAAHSNAAGSNFSITRDWPGLLVDHIEQLSGGGCMYINGAEGDIASRLSFSSTGERNDQFVLDIGAVISQDAQRAFEAASSFSVPNVKILSGDICLPYNPIPTLEQVQAQIDALPEKLEDVNIIKNDKLRTLKAMLKNGEEIPSHYRLRENVIALGELALVPGPFEAFCNIALAISDDSPYQTTLFLGLTNGKLCYLPTVDQIPAGGYEVATFRASSLTGFADNTSELFVDGVVDLLKRLKHH